MAILSMVAGMLPGSVFTVQAQTEVGWAAPVNLSNSGSSKDPLMVIDSQGTTHVFWLDEYDGYKYVNSADGIKWTEPKTVPAPFPNNPEIAIQVLFLPDKYGSIHILWIDKENDLKYSRATSSNLGNPSSWAGGVTLAKSIADFSAVVDSKGAMHVGYLVNEARGANPTGIYYRRLDGSGWSAVKNIYLSNYFRALDPKDANIQLAATDSKDGVDVYIVWDDRSQKRIYLSKSPDGGNTWDGVSQIRGPEDLSGTAMPYNVNASAVGDKVLLTWQAGLPGDQCTQYSQWSVDGAEEFGQPEKVLDDFTLCPQSSQFVRSDSDLRILLVKNVDDLSLLAWNGSNWSRQQDQTEISSFINPVTYDSVNLGCQNSTSYEKSLFIVGCDTGNGGDIWLSSRPIDAIDDWFPPPSTWGNPISVTTTDQNISTLVSIADHESNIHDLWIQNSPLQDGESGATIQYSRWDGEKWSIPATIISKKNSNPSQLSVDRDNFGRLLLAWVDSASGDMYFSWASSNIASSASEWEKPIYIPSVSQANSSPDILVDAAGRMVIAYAITINEKRGIYLMESDNLGETWSQPRQIFDASAANWDMVDHPTIALTEDGRLHVIFGRYSLWGGQRSSLGLYYSQSADGGVTWSVPEIVTENPVSWSELIGDGKNLHRFWQEQKNSKWVNLDQLSSDAGTTWDTPSTLSTPSDDAALTSATMDPFGNLYFLQLAGEKDPSILTQVWNGSGWKKQEPKLLGVDTKDLDFSTIASSASTGYLVASLAAASSDLTSEWRSEILSASQLLKHVGSSPTPFSAIIPNANPVGGAVTQDVLSVSGTSTPTQSPLAAIQDTQPALSKTRNLVGFLLLGGIMSAIVLMFWASSSGKKKNK
jgi:hypothetical protein